MGRRWTDELRDFVSSLRFSGFTILTVVLVIAAGVIISPSLTTYIQQQREISALRESVREHRETVQEIDEEREKWKDPVFIRAQARSRLFYVMPGEIQLSVIEDVVIPEDEPPATRADLTVIEQDWVDVLVSSTILAGLTSGAEGPEDEPEASKESEEE